MTSFHLTKNENDVVYLFFLNYILFIKCKNVFIF